MKPIYKIAVFTNNGDRAVNEDSIGAWGDGINNCLVCCDGLGGHGMGDQASQLVVKVFENMYKKMDSPKNFMAPTFQAAQDILMAEQNRLNAGKKMKTTGVCILTDGNKAYMAHVGDSRGYIFYKGKVLTRTLDHSIPQMMAIAGEIKECEIRNHPERNIVLRVFGVEWEEPMYEIRKPIPLKKCDAFLLCTDGFWELITEDVMERLLAEANSPEEWLNKMTTVIKENGKDRNMDNFSAVAAWKI